jgi:hypothetical protein
MTPRLALLRGAARSLLILLRAFSLEAAGCCPGQAPQRRPGWVLASLLSDLRYMAVADVTSKDCQINCRRREKRIGASHRVPPAQDVRRMPRSQRCLAPTRADGARLCCLKIFWQSRNWHNRCPWRPLQTTSSQSCASSTADRPQICTNLELPCTSCLFGDDRNDACGVQGRR